MGQNKPVSQDGSEKRAAEPDFQMPQSGEDAPNDFETGARLSVNGAETAAPLAQETASRLTKARVMEVVDPAFHRAGILSIAVISPDENRRRAALHALN
jgi:hypothetical protein